MLRDITLLYFYAIIIYHIMRSHRYTLFVCYR